MIIMAHQLPRKKHLIRSMIDEGLLHDLEAVGEIRLSADGRVLGLEACLRRNLMRKYRR